MARSEFTIDLGALRANVRRLRDALDGSELWAVVKADSYGHGALDCARVALEEGATALCVAALAEALELRRVLPEARILVFGPTHDDAAARAAHVELCVGDEIPEGLPVHVKLDTGMGRLGTRDPAEATRIAEAVQERGCELVGLMTHFATADEQGDDYFGEQLTLFTEFAGRFRERYPDVIVHAANSPAIFRERWAQFDMVRSGVAIYGLDNTVALIDGALAR